MDAVKAFRFDRKNKMRTNVHFFVVIKVMDNNA